MVFLEQKTTNNSYQNYDGSKLGPKNYVVVSHSWTSGEGGVFKVAGSPSPRNLLVIRCNKPQPWWLGGRDNGKDFSFLVPSLFLKLNDNDVKSFLNGYPIF